MKTSNPVFHPIFIGSMIVLLLNDFYLKHQIDSQKTKVEIINVTLRDNNNFQKWKILKQLQKQYRKIIKKLIIEELK